ncbi:MAG: ATP-dependent sacrificial sulfur transferase LarE [Methanocellales archaeon]|nr:ATP-dependent sacrificial sulfur transferase LarE [Methanocellales archaeon]
MKTDYITEKMDEIREAIAQKGAVLIAFSGGVDSSVVASLAYDALAEKASAITIDSGLLPPRELEDAKNIATRIGIPHRIIGLDVLNDPKFVENPLDRCYHCKKRMLSGLRKIADAGIIMDGTNASDLGEDRPGHRALKEFDVFTPLLDFGVSKSEVREMAARLNLPNANKPSMSCLATRIPYGQRITKGKLHQIREAEQFLQSKGITDLRVRHHGNTACIELPKDGMQVILANTEEIIKKFREIGFECISHKLRVHYV